MLKKTWLYYLLILLPVAGLIFLGKQQYDTALFVCFFVYLLPYRGIIDGTRLYHKGVIEKKQIWSIMFSSRVPVFRKLYLP